MLDSQASSKISVLEKGQAQDQNLSEKEVKFATNNVRLSSSSASFEGKIFDFDGVICWIVICICYLFAAIEEADYQVLSASVDSNNQDVIDDDSWSLISLLPFFKK